MKFDPTDYKTYYKFEIVYAVYFNPRLYFGKINGFSLPLSIFF